MLPPVSLKQIEKFLHFSFKTVKTFFQFETPTPRAKTVGRKPNSGVVRTCESRGGRPGNGQAWNWLVDYNFNSSGSFVVTDCSNSLGTRTEQPFNMRRISEMGLQSQEYDKHLLLLVIVPSPSRHCTGCEI